MSRFVRIIMAVALVGGCGQLESHEGNQVTDAKSDLVTWARSDLYEGHAASLIGPHRRLRLAYEGDKVKIANGGGRSLNLEVLPPASVLWRPDGDAVAINNGNGSGQTSQLIVVENGTIPTALEDVQLRLKNHFFKQTGCRVDPKSVSVTAEGWSFSSNRIWVRFESWDREDFCNSDILSFAEYDLSRHEIVESLSELESLRRFCADPDFFASYKPNCARSRD
jgi:hypothetical protein